MSRGRIRLTGILLALVFAFVGGAIGYALSRMQDPAYDATVVWQLRSNTDAIDLDARSLLDMLLSEEVLARAADVVDAPADELRTATTARLEDESTLRLSVSGGTAASARDRAEAVASAFEARHGATAGERTATTLRRLDAEILAANREIRALQVLTPDEEDADVDARVEAHAALLGRREEVASLAAARRPLATLERQATSVRQVRPLTTRNVALGILVAALANLGLGLWRPRRSDRAAPVRAAHRDLHGMATFPSAESEDAPELRRAASRLRTRLSEVAEAGPPNIFLITSVEERTGKTMVARHVAEDFARLGHRTLLVDGNLAEPTLADRYGVKDENDDAPTTLAWLQAPGDVDEVMTVSLGDDRRMDLIPQFRSARPAPGRARMLFEGFGLAIRRWHAYDAIIVDTSALLSVEDARFLAPYATVVVLVAKAEGPVGRRGLARAKKLLRYAGADRIGVVVNEGPSFVDADGARSRSTGALEATADGVVRARVVEQQGHRPS